MFRKRSDLEMDIRRSLNLLREILVLGELGQSIFSKGYTQRDPSH
uniref:Uncharacterized protein n=1 Tax=Brassica oleracea TaxID=3712 RepID=A0A3P6FFF1_BRAOL|nr:unnamed protein product [Brassica oleracea]